MSCSISVKLFIFGINTMYSAALIFYVSGYSKQSFSKFFKTSIFITKNNRKNIIINIQVRIRI